MLLEAGIEHEWRDRTPPGYEKVEEMTPPEERTHLNWGWQVIVYRPDGERMISAIEGYGTYGYGMYGEQGDFIEIMGLLTSEEEAYWGSVRGFLTAENVFWRIKEAVECLK
jgi:hypothetical protein